MNPTEVVTSFLRDHGTLDPAGLAILAGVFVVTGWVPIPRTALCLVSGAIFGPMAILVIMPSTTFGGVVAFLVARYLFSQPLYRMAARRRNWRAVLSAIDEGGWRVVGLMRFASAMPTFSQNYLFGLTRIGLLPYVLATFFFTIPQVTLYVYLGALGRASLLEDKGSPAGLALVGLAAACLLAVLVTVTRKVRAALRAETGDVE